MKGLNVKDKTNSKIKVLGYDKSKGSHLKSSDIAAIGSELRSLAVNDTVLPEDVIDAARNPESSMHSYFEWDNKKAAHKYRMINAKYIIRSMRMKIAYIQVENETGAEKAIETTVRMLHSAPDVDQEGSGNYVYKEVASVLNDIGLQQSVVSDMYKYLLGAFRRFNDFSNLAEDLDSLEPVIYLLGKKIGLSESKIKSQIIKIRKGI
jgi:hypothetical protein